MAGAPWRMVLAAAAAVALSPSGGYGQEAVAARTLRSGTIVSASDLRPAEGRAVADMAGLVGLETRRAIYAGRPVLPADLGPPTLVRRNAVVAMLYRDRGLALRAEGRALDSGGAGDDIRVVNLASRQVVRAVVIGDDEVEALR